MSKNGELLPVGWLLSGVYKAHRLAVQGEKAPQSLTAVGNFALIQCVPTRPQRCSRCAGFVADLRLAERPVGERAPVNAESDENP